MKDIRALFENPNQFTCNSNNYSILSFSTRASNNMLLLALPCHKVTSNKCAVASCRLPVNGTACSIYIYVCTNFNGLIFSRENAFVNGSIEITKNLFDKIKMFHCGSMMNWPRLTTYVISRRAMVRYISLPPMIDSSLHL